MEINIPAKDAAPLKRMIEVLAQTTTGEEKTVMDYIALSYDLGRKTERIRYTEAIQQMANEGYISIHDAAGLIAAATKDLDDD